MSTQTDPTTNPLYGVHKKTVRRHRSERNKTCSFDRTTLAIHKLRINVQSLMAEAKAIRKEERRAGLCYFTSLFFHRTKHLRNESRCAHLILAFLRGTAFRLADSGQKPVDLKRIDQKMASLGVADVKNRNGVTFREWLAGAVLINP